MGNIVIAIPALSDGATLTGINEDPAAPATNLQRMKRNVIARTLDLTTIAYEADFGQAKMWNLLALLSTNGTSAATWRIRAAATQAGLISAPTYDSGVISFWASPGLDDINPKHALLWVPGGVTARWLRIDIFDAANPDGFFRADRLVVDDAWQVSVGHQYGSGDGIDDSRRSDKSLDGDVLITPGVIKPFANIVFDFLSDADMRDQMRPLLWRIGASKDALVVADPDDTAGRAFEMWHGLLKNRTLVSNEAFDSHRARLQINPL